MPSAQTIQFSSLEGPLFTFPFWYEFSVQTVLPSWVWRGLCVSSNPYSNSSIWQSNEISDDSTHQINNSMKSSEALAQFEHTQYQVWYRDDLLPIPKCYKRAAQRFIHCFSWIISHFLSFMPNSDYLQSHFVYQRCSWFTDWPLHNRWKSS